MYLACLPMGCGNICIYNIVSAESWLLCSLQFYLIWQLDRRTKYILVLCIEIVLDLDLTP